ncbi:MAG: hypothetical protein VKP62_03190 [Candidatus Sericytochromatia bacterium]|nr:hypothetical protein [Candidatus Sericytochromatia bacterium]
MRRLTAVTRTLLLAAGAGLMSGCAAALTAFDQDFQSATAPMAAPGAPYTQTYDETGTEVKYVYFGPFAGWLSGGRAVRYTRFNRSLYAGAMIYGTVPFIGQRWSPAFGYAGLQGGYEGHYGPLIYNTTLLAGVTSAISECTANPLGQQFTLEPSVSLGLRIPGMIGWKASIVGGVLVMPLVPEQSGWTLGLRIDQKIMTASVPAAD